MSVNVNIEHVYWCTREKSRSDGFVKSVRSGLARSKKNAAWSAYVKFVRDCAQAQILHFLQSLQDYSRFPVFMPFFFAGFLPGTSPQSGLRTCRPPHRASTSMRRLVPLLPGKTVPLWSGISLWSHSSPAGHFFLLPVHPQFAGMPAIHGYYWSKQPISILEREEARWTDYEWLIITGNGDNDTSNWLVLIPPGSVSGKFETAIPCGLRVQKKQFQFSKREMIMEGGGFPPH